MTSNAQSRLMLVLHFIAYLGIRERQYLFQEMLADSNMREREKRI